MKKQDLPPLPLVDGCLFMDNSGWIEGMMTCHRLLQYKSLNKRIAAAEKPALNFGSAIHLALEYRYKHYGNRMVDDEYYNHVAGVLTEFFDEHQPPMDDWRTLNWCMTLLRKYNEKYDIEQFNLLAGEDKKPLVELSFTIKLYTWQGWLPNSALGINFPRSRILDEREGECLVSIDIIFTGKIDLPIAIDGSIYINDHKTTSMLGPMFWDQMRRSSQAKGYVFAFEKVTGMKVYGYMINAIRTKEPPLYVQAGKQSTRSGQSPATWWNESLQRERFIIKPGDLDEWKRNTLTLINEFFWHYQQDYMPMKTTWCAQWGKCAYYDVCQLDEADRAFFLASGKYANNEWTPLKAASQPKQ